MDFFALNILKEGLNLPALSHWDRGPKNVPKLFEKDFKIFFDFKDTVRWEWLNGKELHHFSDIYLYIFWKLIEFIVS